MDVQNMDQDSSPRKSPFEDLSKDELVLKCKGLLAIAHKAKQAKSELQSENEQIKNELQKFESEKKKFIENIQTLQELVNSLTEQKLNYITELDSERNKLKLFNDQCNKYSEEIEKYKLEIATKDKNIALTSEKFSDLDTELISLRRQNKRLLEENEQLISQLTELEARTVEFNNIGLQQREQLKVLEEEVQTDKLRIEELNNTIRTLELNQTSINESDEYENKIKEITKLYEYERSQKEKYNLKLKMYKDKILKCATCISQLKNTRFILSKTVKEYSENIPKWQNDIIKASKILETKINDLSKENSDLKDELKQLKFDLNKSLPEHTTDTENQSTELIQSRCEIERLNAELSQITEELAQMSNNNIIVGNELQTFKSQYKEISDSVLPLQISENTTLKQQLKELSQINSHLSTKNSELGKLVEDLKIEIYNKNQPVQEKTVNDEVISNLTLQIKALESEKDILVKEKLSAKDNLVDSENQNKTLKDQVSKMKLELKNFESQLERLHSEKAKLQESYNNDKDSEFTNLKCKIMVLQEQYTLLKKEYDDAVDLNSLLKEEVETLKFSLEQPKDDAENLTDLNVSLQADIVKLETKLAAYKQENNSLLAEVKEFRIKKKEYESVITEYEDAKSKLASYRSENSELLNEMKEINQVLKERGEAISKLQKAIDEMEMLIDTLEKDRDNLKQEKSELIKKIELLEYELNNVEQNKKDNIEVMQKIEVEKDEAIKKNAEKDVEIAVLKDELEKIKQQSTPVELPNEDMSTSTISKAEENARMKDLDETFEEKYTKLRIFALKLKKKLNETTAQLQNAEEDKKRLEKFINDNDLLTNKSMLMSGKEHNDHVSEKKVAPEVSVLERKIESLTASVEASQTIVDQLKKVKAELDDTNQQLHAEIEAHNITKENLEKARRDVKKKSVLSLEMEDYERSMKELTTKMEENKKKMLQMESTIDAQERTITAMKTQIKLLEEQIKTEESQNRLIKEELQQAIEEGKEKYNVIQARNNTITKIEHDLEEEKRKIEELKLETTLLLSEKEKAIMSLAEEKVELNNKFKKLEFKYAEINEKLKTSNTELEDLKTEYTSYKVRAQAVLRQNQIVDHSQEEQLKEEAAALKTQIEILTAKLTRVQDQYKEQTMEVEASQRRLVEATNEAARAQQRTSRLHVDLTRLSQQLESERAQHKLQISTLTQCYKTQMSELELEHQKQVEELKKQAVSREEINSSARNLEGTNHNQDLLPVIHKEENSDGELDINVSLIPREEGEGSESAPSPPPSKSYLTSAGSGRSPVPLERLLEEGVPEDDALDATSLSLSAEQEIAELKRKLQTQQQRVKHVTILLAESERESARMAQLSELLKSELRRVRGSTQHTHNTEYMKNVTLKFLTLAPGDERSRLVPVLQKLLTLTNEETQKIQAIAKGLDPNPGKSWGSFLPWPGGK